MKTDQLKRQLFEEIFQNTMVKALEDKELVKVNKSFCKNTLSPENIFHRINLRPLFFLHNNINILI